MNSKKEAPERLETLQGQKNSHFPVCERSKDTELLSKRQQKVYELLLTGQYSATDISIRLGYCDPRSYIKKLRGKGIVVRDEWVHLEEVRFKRYWVEPEPLKSNVPDVQTVGEVIQTDFKDLFDKRRLYD